MGEDFFIYLMVGFLAQMINGTLGMAYGIISSSFLMSLGATPAIASASVHASEVVTSGTSWAAHFYNGNVKKRLMLRLAIPGVLGALLGALFLSFADARFIKPLVNGYLLLMGGYVLYKALATVQLRKRVRGLMPLGFVAGFLDSACGGGWGSLTTTQMIAQGVPPRFAVGTAIAAEFFVSLAATLVFLGTLGLGHWQVVLGLLLGGALASPPSAWLAKWLPRKPMMLLVGTLIIGLSLWRLWS